VNGRSLALGGVAVLASWATLSRRDAKALTLGVVTRAAVDDAVGSLARAGSRAESRHTRPYAMRNAVYGELVATLPGTLTIRVDADRTCHAPTALLYDGDVNVGHAQLSRVTGPNDEHLAPYECDDEIRHLAERLQRMGHPSVTYWTMWRSELRNTYIGQGLGVDLYEAALRFVHAKFDRPAIIFPEMCMEEGTTSYEAERVWGSLHRRWESEGWAVASIPLTHAPRRRQGHRAGSAARAGPVTPADRARFDAIAADARTLFRDAERTGNFSWDDVGPWGKARGLTVFGSGMHRAVFRDDRDPRRVVKVNIYDGKSSRSELRVWREAPDWLRPYLVPVLGAGKDGRWILMEYAEPAEAGLASDPVKPPCDPLPDALVQRMEACGLGDVYDQNLSRDGRILDYGDLQLDAWKWCTKGIKPTKPWLTR